MTQKKYCKTWFPRITFTELNAELFKYPHVDLQQLYQD